MTELINMNANNSDDEDLEQLRLAALQTIKKPQMLKPNFENPLPKISSYNNGSIAANHYNPTPHFHKKTRGFNPRNARMNMPNNRIRNTNLISIPTVEPEAPNKENSTPKLVLPQDRYCNKEQSSDVSKEVEQSSKFSRYDNSDNSDSDSDVDDLKASDDELKLERSNSLEALMQELENEIQGNTAAVKQEVVKPKAKVKKAKSKVGENGENSVAESVVKANVDEDASPEKVNKIADLQQQQQQQEVLISHNNIRESDAINRYGASRNFARQRNETKRHKKFPNKPRSLPYVLPNPPYHSNELYMSQQPVPVAYDASFFSPASVMPLQNLMPLPVGNTYLPLGPQPLGPLVINTDRDRANIPMAPLSPRSAAFVLQNQKIIERRKKSPRRSYSRSPTPPRYRSSLSPRRSLSPRYNERRSITPVPVRKFDKKPSLSPRLTRPVSPREKYVNATSKPSPGKVTDSPPPPVDRKVSVKARLGNRLEEKEKLKVLKRSCSPAKSPDLQPITESLTEDSNDLDLDMDPVLEARKKKFESSEIVHKEGIIRLKPTKTESSDDADADEDLLLEVDDDFIDTKVDDIFSDEESDLENEGRFKVKMHDSDSPVPTKRHRRSFDPEKILLLRESDSKKSRKAGSRDRNRYKVKQRERSREQKESLNAKRNSDRSGLKLKQRTVLRSEKERKTVTSPIEGSKKIEIKIRNPAKYEEKKGKSVRKVEIAKVHPVEADEPEPEIVIDNEDDVEDVSDRGGDLRAQLSRKRAERQKLPISENFKSSRLLQSALEEVVYKQKTKKLKVKSNRESTKVFPKRAPLYTDSYFIRIGLGSGPSVSNHRTVHVVKYASSDILFAPSGTYPCEGTDSSASGAVKRASRKKQEKKRSGSGLNQQSNYIGSNN